MKRAIIGTVLMLTACGALVAQAVKPADAWARLNFLVGDWVGVGSGAPGQGEGGSSFVFELDRNVLVRRSSAKYPPAPGQAAGVSHEDLIIIYPAAGGAFRAIYFDNEAHTIEYGLTIPKDGSVVFESIATVPGPRYRLTYDLRPDGTLGNTFAIAMPGGEFKPYVTGALKRSGLPGARKDGPTNRARSSPR